MLKLKTLGNYRLNTKWKREKTPVQITREILPNFIVLDEQYFCFAEDKELTIIDIENLKRRVFSWPEIMAIMWIKLVPGVKTHLVMASYNGVFVINLYGENTNQKSGDPCCCICINDLKLYTVHFATCKVGTYDIKDADAKVFEQTVRAGP